MVKERFIKHFPLVALVLVAGLILHSCGSSFSSVKPVKIHYDPIVDQAVSKRTGPAHIAEASENELMNSGYVALGTLSVDYTKQACFGEECREFAHSDTPTNQLLKEAAGRGADLVVLTDNNTPTQRGISRNTNECIEWRHDHMLVPYGIPGPVFEAKTCLEWEKENGLADVLNTTGTLWRHDPALAMNARWFVAIEAADLDMIETLLKKGVDVNLVAHGNQTALHLAAQGGSSEVVRLLVRRGADIHATHLGREPLDYATRACSPQAVQVLLTAGADVNRRPDSDMWPMQWAYQDNDPAASNPKCADVVKIYLAHGAPVNVKMTGFGHTPIMSAAIHNQTDVLKLLIDKGADLNATDEDGNTALHYAAMWGRKGAINLLRNKGADVHAKNDDGQTPYDRARENNRTDVLALLE